MRSEYAFTYIRKKILFCQENFYNSSKYYNFYKISDKYNLQLNKLKKTALTSLTKKGESKTNQKATAKDGA